MAETMNNNQKQLQGAQEAVPAPEHWTFNVRQVTGEYGNQYALLTSNEYPWMNIQIVPTPEKQRDIILRQLEKKGGWIKHAEGRTDFVAIHAGGGTKEHPTIHITQQNVQAVCNAMERCLQEGADWWATHKLMNL